ncbi:hypothetical protein DFH06DRAFT_986861 [Mycena polygramma]|nr:hypothetical protein DFH06DRAFT_986861 [Mycena polygramma]
MSVRLPCTIPADPDISGVGVRTAIYAQNVLSFIPAIWALWDGEVSVYELECVETQSTTILVTAFAILISAMVQANRGLSNFHASIVLDLSWMNNTNTFIYFLLYVQHKSQPGPQQIMPTFSAWMNHLRASLSWRLHIDKSSDAESSVIVLLPFLVSLTVHRHNLEDSPREKFGHRCVQIRYEPLLRNTAI